MYNAAGGRKKDMGNGSNLRKGLRCQICTGCGLCPGVTSAGAAAGSLCVLSEDALSGDKVSIRGNRRLAVADIGTTTIAMLLYDVDGSVTDRFVAVNPQTAYGADVLSRIRAAEHMEAAADMQAMVRGQLEQGLKRFAGSLKSGEELYLVLAANTTMTYLLMGWDPAELGRAPFCASHLSGAETKIGDVSCFVFPGLSAFVGGDIAAGIYAVNMCGREGLTLLLDLGTNGEMVLGNRERRIACSTAAGPAFEGGVNRGVWGADMISLLAKLRQEDILDETGLLAEPYFTRGIRIGNVTVTQEAVRNVQLAKGAIAAGIEILLKKYGAGLEDVERVVLAGGFGYFLQSDAAVRIGLLPETLGKKTITGGNTALAGAFMAGRRIVEEGKTDNIRVQLEKTVLQTDVINLAEEPDYEKLYMSRLGLDQTSTSIKDFS